MGCFGTVDLGFSVERSADPLTRRRKRRSVGFRRPTVAWDTARIETSMVYLKLWHSDTQHCEVVREFQDEQRELANQLAIEFERGALYGGDCYYVSEIGPAISS